MTRSEARSAKRKEVVEAIVIRGEPVAVVARAYNIALRTVFGWLARYRSGGWEALQEGSRKGRPRKVSGADLEWLYEAVTVGSPLNHKFEFCLWTLNLMCAMVERERGIELSKSGVSRLLAHLGLNPQRPLYKSYKQDPKRIEQYLSRTFPEIVERARAPGGPTSISWMKRRCAATPIADGPGARWARRRWSETAVDASPRGRSVR